MQYYRTEVTFNQRQLYSCRWDIGTVEIMDHHTNITAIFMTQVIVVHVCCSTIGRAQKKK